jgi:iron complex outermembrane receptor protein
VLTPFSRFSISLDWFDIRVDDAIRTVPVQFEIDNCVQSLGASEFCPSVVREPVGTPRPRTPGSVYQVYQNYRNLAYIESRGLDAAVRYGTPLGIYDLDVTVNYTYLDELNIQPLPSEPAQRNVGQLNGDDRLGAGFMHRANLSTTLSVSKIALTWRIHYQSAIQDTLDENGPLLDPQYNNVDEYFYHDLYARFVFGRDDNFTVYAGINNVLDTKPPLIDQNGASNITGTETAAESYDPIGRYLFAGLTWKL